MKIGHFQFSPKSYSPSDVTADHCFFNPFYLIYKLKQSNGLNKSVTSSWTIVEKTNFRNTVDFQGCFSLSLLPPCSKRIFPVRQLISHCIRKYTLSKETNNKIKTNRNKFSLVSDVDVEKAIFFNVELKVPYEQSLNFLSFMSTSFIFLLNPNSNYIAAIWYALTFIKKRHEHREPQPVYNETWL